MKQHKSSSIYELEPLEVGGIISRQGFTFQDHVASCFLIEMVNGAEIVEVWCETQDDITLIKPLSAGRIEVEFIQVKNNDFDHLWSIAELCKKNSTTVNKVGTSILEKSLKNDRCAEPCKFRIVTSLGVRKELQCLTLPLGSSSRRKTAAAFITLAKNLKKKAGRFKSHNGNDCVFWASNTLWQPVGKTEHIENRNLLNLGRFADSIGEQLSQDQIYEVYQKVLLRAKEAAETSHLTEPEKKKINKDEFARWLQDSISTHVRSSPAGTTNLQEKLNSAGLIDYYDTALEHRHEYRRILLKPKYQTIDDLKDSTLELAARLHHLKSKLDAGALPDNGFEFHNHCLDEIQSFRQSIPETARPSLVFLQGCMYDVTNRCPHRFKRAKL